MIRTENHSSAGGEGSALAEAKHHFFLRTEYEKGNAARMGWARCASGNDDEQDRTKYGLPSHQPPNMEIIT